LGKGFGLFGRDVTEVFSDGDVTAGERHNNDVPFDRFVRA